VKIKISQKVIFLFILLLISLGFILSLYFFKSQKKALLSEFDARATALLGSLAASSEYPVLVGNSSGLEKIGKGVLRQKDVVACEIVNMEGIILFRGGEERDGHDLRQYTCPIVIERPLDSADETLIFGFEKGKFEEIGKIRLTLSSATAKKETLYQLSSI